MLIFWRGIGWSVPLILFGWLFLIIGIWIASNPAQVDEAAAAAGTDRLFALAFALSTATVYYLMYRADRRRAAAVEPGDPDHFMFVPLKYWAWLYAAGTVFLGVRSFTY